MPSWWGKTYPDQFQFTDYKRFNQGSISAYSLAADNYNKSKRTYDNFTKSSVSVKNGSLDYNTRATADIVNGLETGQAAYPRVSGNSPGLANGANGSSITFTETAYYGGHYAHLI